MINREVCCDCASPEVKVNWGLGSRCQPCSDVWREKVHAKRQAEFEAERLAQEKHVCGEEIEGASDNCEECCDHDFDAAEGGYCMNEGCGANGYDR